MRLALLSQLFVQGLSLVAISVQMRFVPRADFAVFGLAVLLVEFPRMLTTMGVGAAVIQKNQISSDELSFLFWLNQVFGVIAMLASIAAAPLLMQPGDATGLLPVTIALASGSLFAALARVPQAILERDLRIVVTARGQWISMGLASAISIALGIAGFRVWALVAHQWLELVIFSLVLWPNISWRPSRPSWKGYSADLFHYSSAFTLSQWIHWLGQRFDRYWLWRLLAGSSLGLEWIGLYTQTMNLILRPALMITGPLTGILLSALSRTMGDKHALDELHRSVMRLAAIALCPVCFGLIATAEESLYLLGGDKWRVAAGLLIAMSSIMVSRAAINLAVIALSASGKPRLIIGSSVAASLTLVVAAIVSTSLMTKSATPESITLAMAAGQTIATAAIILVPTLWLCSYALETPFMSLIQPWLKPLAVSGLMAGIVFGARFLPLPWDSIYILTRFAIFTLLGAIVYSVLMFPDIRWAFSFIRKGRFGQNDAK
jgi:O-antigen/teichoic acid export membrane protein